MILASHLIISAYGFWLPNDPRGSWSDFVYSWELYKFGPATKVVENRDYSKDAHNADLRRAAKQALKFPVVKFNDSHRSAIAAGFGRACDEANYQCFACCIGHDHAHLIIQRHDRDSRIIIGHLKAHATRELTSQNIHPLTGYIGKRGGLPTPWAEYGWSIYIDDEGHLEKAIRYVEKHPMKEGLSKQHWNFVKLK